MLLQFDGVPVEPVDYETAAACYRSCRRAGETVRALLDCLVAAVAIRVGAALLARDRDFEALARHTGLQLDG
jgi:predicted nucleic acid-binding protein